VLKKILISKRSPFFLGPFFYKFCDFYDKILSILSMVYPAESRIFSELFDGSIQIIHMLFEILSDDRDLGRHGVIHLNHGGVQIEQICMCACREMLPETVGQRFWKRSDGRF